LELWEVHKQGRDVVFVAVEKGKIVDIVAYVPSGINRHCARMISLL
jgi:hypothetical protein